MIMSKIFCWQKSWIKKKTWGPKTAPEVGNVDKRCTVPGTAFAMCSEMVTGRDLHLSNQRVLSLLDVACYESMSQIFVMWFLRVGRGWTTEACFKHSDVPRKSRNWRSKLQDYQWNMALTVRVKRCSFREQIGKWLHVCFGWFFLKQLRVSRMNLPKTKTGNLLD